MDTQDRNSGESSSRSSESEDRLTDLAETSITPEQSGQVRGGGRLELPNLVSANPNPVERFKCELEDA